MDSPLMAATTQRGDEPGNGTIAAMLAQKNVHDRLYSGPSQKKLRVKDARQQKEEAKVEKRLGAATEACLRLHREGVEQKKEVLQKAQEKKDDEFREDHPFRPTFPKTPLFKAEKISGSRQEAWQRLQSSNSQKALSLEKSRDKKEEEFTEDHPFKPTLVDAKNLKFAPKMPPRTTQEEWIQTQKDWQRKKVEKRTEKLREKLEEEINYLEEHAVHRNAQEVDAAAACKRLHQQHARQQERQHKRRLEHIADAHEYQNRIHRKLDKTPVASTKVVQMVERLYSHDLETRNERQQQRMKQKRKAEEAEQLLLDALSVHTPPAGGAPHSYHHDQVSLRIAKELAQLREQVSELHHRAMRTDYQDLVKKQTAPKAKTRPRSKEAPRSVSPSYAAQHAKRQGGAAATRPPVPRQGSASPTSRPQPQGRRPSPSTPRSKPSPKATSSRPQAKAPSESPRKAGGSTPRPKSTSSPRSRAREERDPKTTSPQSRSTRESSPVSKSFADQVRAANSDGKTSSSQSDGEPRAASPRKRSDASSDASSRGKQLTPRRLRPASVSSASDAPPRRSDSSDEAARAAAATKIQSRVRGKQARQEVEKRRQLFAKSRSETKSLDAAEADGDTEEQETRARDAPQADDDADDQEIKEREVAAIKIQSRVRGKQARQEAQQRRLKRAETRSLGSNDEKELAATKIQSRFRGNQARKTVMKMQDSKQADAGSRDEGSSSQKNDSSQSSENEGEES